jgi:ABC-type branched-subunit amino acid transport system substrate-binding protein
MGRLGIGGLRPRDWRLIVLVRGNLTTAGHQSRGLLLTLRLRSVQVSNLFFSFLLISSFFLLNSCSSVQPVVKVGLVAPFEGEQRAIGYDVIYSARLAVREINEAGGINGHRVALVALDDGGDVAMSEETAVSLSIDPGVVAVVGNWLPENTAVAADIYAQHNLPFIAMGKRPFGEITNLPPEFTQAYEAVTPFDETAGVYAGTTYDAFQLLWLAMARSAERTGAISREGVAESLVGLEYQGMAGTVSLSP